MHSISFIMAQSQPIWAELKSALRGNLHKIVSYLGALTTKETRQASASTQTSPQQQQQQATTMAIGVGSSTPSEPQPLCHHPRPQLLSFIVYPRLGWHLQIWCPFLPHTENTLVSIFVDSDDKTPLCIASSPIPPNSDILHSLLPPPRAATDP